MKPNVMTTVSQSGNLAKKLAKQLRGGEVLALVGPLGSGKTTFTQYLAKELKSKDAASSPTFVIMNHYRIKLRGQPKHLLHLDLYRTKGIKEVKALGLMEMWGRPDTITVIEWADKIKNILPSKTVTIQFRQETNNP